MSKPVKNMITAEYARLFDGVESAVVVDVRGIDANTNNELRDGLRKQNIRVTVIKNTLAKKAFEGSPLEALEPALEGPSALAFGGESVVDVARAVVDWAKKVKEFELKGASLDGVYFEGDAGVKALSNYPTRDEAQAKVVQVALTPAGNVVSAATSGGSNLMGIVKEIQERLEKGETISKAG